MFRRWSNFVKFGLVLILVSSCTIFLLHLHLRSGKDNDGLFQISRVSAARSLPKKHNSFHQNEAEERQFNPKIIAHLAKVVQKSMDKDSWNGLASSQQKKSLKELVKNNTGYRLNYNVHAFYYAWYGNPKHDGQYFHWNHEYLPHWDKKISAKFPTGHSHFPPEDIAATFYPELGPYSSLDRSITNRHMKQMQIAGIGVLALSWYPPGMADDHGKPIEPYISTIFDIANRYNIKVCFHIEPYKDRDAKSMRENIKYILETYGDHPAFYRHLSLTNGSKLPLVYIYDSYLVPTSEWKKLLTKRGSVTVRGTELDFLAIGLLVEKKHMNEITHAGFDGVYTYFAADGFSYGSTRKNWNDIARLSQKNRMIYIPSVGPGYDDTKVRPWNGVNSRQRRDGAYYDESWEAAVEHPSVQTVSITSFNEWHEGTQIESATPVPKRGSFVYQTYEPHNPDFYLEMTKKWSNKLLHRPHG